MVDFDPEWAREMNNKIGSIVPSKFPEVEVTVRPAVMEALAGLAAHIDRLRNQIPLTAAANGTFGVEGLVSQDDENCRAIERAMHKIFDPSPGAIVPDASPESPNPGVDKKASLKSEVDEGEDWNYDGFDEIFAKIEEQKRLEQNLPAGEHSAHTGDDIKPAPVDAHATPHLLNTEAQHPHQSPPLYPHQDPTVYPPYPNDPGFNPAPPINDADASYLGIPPTTSDIPSQDRSAIGQTIHGVGESYIHDYIDYLDMSGNGEAAQGVRQCWDADNTPITVGADRVDKWLSRNFNNYNNEIIKGQVNNIAGQALQEFHAKSTEAQQRFLNANHGVIPFNSSTPWGFAQPNSSEEKTLFGNTYQLSTSMHGVIDPHTGKYTCQTQTHIYGKFNYGQLNYTDNNTIRPLQYYITPDSNDLTTNPGAGGMNNMTPGGIPNPPSPIQKPFNDPGKVLAIANRPSPGIAITGTSHIKDREGTIPHYP